MIEIGRWKCHEDGTGFDWVTRYARNGDVEVSCDTDGLELSECVSGYGGATGTYRVPAAVLAWLVGVGKVESND